MIELARIRLNVTDLPRAVAFYRDALGFAVTDVEPSVATNASVARSAILRLGSEEIELFEWARPGAAYPSDSSAADLWFQHFAIVCRDIAAAHDRLGSFPHAPISEHGPQLLPPANGSVTAFKFRDPDGHPLEFVHFPRGSGDPRWQEASSDVNIGIDHSALSVSDSDASIAFYRSLGLDLQSRQINRGAAQDRLDGLAGVAVEVIALTPSVSATPHVELLCYSAPQGRTLSGVRHDNDIVDTTLIFRSSDAQAGRGEIDVGKRRDPDGHALILLPFLR